MRMSQIETPALVLDLDVMKQNMEGMRRYCQAVGVALRPHYKSHKCTAIAHMQMAEGAKGLCCAKLSEAEDLVRAGIEDVLIANQILDSAKIARTASLAKCCRLTVCVDQSGNIAELEDAAALQNAIIHCLVEFDVGMNRCGVYTQEEVLALARQIEACPHLVFDGIQAYAGHIAHWTDYEKRLNYSVEVEVTLSSLKKYLEEKGIGVQEVSGVSTGTVFNRRKGTVYTEIQAGSYLFMDAAYRALDLDFAHCLFVLSSVIREGNGHLVMDAGMKSVSTDSSDPFFLEYPKEPINFSEEHCTLPIEKGKLGDQLLLVPGHCCTTVNLYDFIYLIKDGRVVDRLPVTSRGKSL